MHTAEPLKHGQFIYKFMGFIYHRENKNYNPVKLYIGFVLPYTYTLLQPPQPI